MLNKHLKEGERLDDLQYNNLQIIQHSQKYCFTTDAVLLANFVTAKKESKVVDLCSGSGVIGILVQAKTKAENVTLVELQEYFANMSKRSVELNNLSDKISIINMPLQNISKQIGVEKYDVVVCNPPYKMKNSSLLSQDNELNICKHEIAVTLEEVILESSKLLKYGGYFYTINKEERLTDIICSLRKYKIEPKNITVVPSKKGSSLVLVKAKKGGKSGVRVNILPL